MRSTVHPRYTSPTLADTLRRSLKLGSPDIRCLGGSTIESASQRSVVGRSFRQSGSVNTVIGNMEMDTEYGRPSREDLHSSIRWFLQMAQFCGDFWGRGRTGLDVSSVLRVQARSPFKVVDAGRLGSSTHIDLHICLVGEGGAMRLSLAHDTHDTPASAKLTHPMSTVRPRSTVR